MYPFYPYGGGFGGFGGPFFGGFLGGLVGSAFRPYPPYYYNRGPFYQPYYRRPFRPYRPYW